MYTMSKLRNQPGGAWAAGPRISVFKGQIPHEQASGPPASSSSSFVCDAGYK